MLSDYKYIEDMTGKLPMTDKVMDEYYKDPTDDATAGGHGDKNPLKRYIQYVSNVNGETFA